MKRPLKLAINVIASLLVMISGTIASAQADEVWLDFSVPEADVVVASNTGKSQLSRLQKTLAEPGMKASKNNANFIALDFSVPNADAMSAPVSDGISNNKLPPPATKKPTTKPSVNPTSKPSSRITRSKQVKALRRAIIGQESAGKFNIVNPHSGALGYGQVMPENVASWSRAALGREVSGVEFLNNPDLQILVIDHKLNQYFNRALMVTGGDEATAVKRVAATWYSGDPSLYTSTRPQFYNGYLYPSIADYSQSILLRYQQHLLD